MTNTYKDDAPIEVKTHEELRCIRCVLERILREMNEGTFVDYQMEKFGKNFKGDTHSKQAVEKGRDALKRLKDRN